MTKKAYIVRGYVDNPPHQGSWNVVGYYKEEQAIEHCELCNNWANPIYNPYDKEKLCSTKSIYHVVEVELVDHLNTYLGDS